MKIFLFVCLFFTGTVFAKDFRTFTYFYCTYKTDKDGTNLKVISDMLVYDGSSEYPPYSIISERKIRAIFEGWEYKENKSSGITLTRKDGVNCGSSSAIEEYVGPSLLDVLHAQKSFLKYRVMPDFHKKDEYLSGLKNLKIMKIEPLIENKGNLR